MAETNKLKILIVEDEEPIRRGLIDVFLYHGYEVDFAVDGNEGLKKASQEKYDMVLLDVMLPGCDGFSVCNELRKLSREQPIIMLTAKTTDEDILTGLSLGADDYVSKPFSVAELVLRVEAVLRRSRRILTEMPKLVIGPLSVDPVNLRGSLGSRSGEIVFTRREVEILQYLEKNSNRPVSREELLAEVWGYSKTGYIETRTVDIHVAKLRRKIEMDSKEPQILLTIRGEGYRLAEFE